MSNHNYHYPTSYNVQDSGRPLTPGTPGTFAMSTSSLGKYNDNSFYPSQYDPHANDGRAISPAPVQYNDGGARRDTYFFNKEGGPATSAAAAGGAAGAAQGAQRTGFFGWIKRHPIWSVVIAILIVVIAVAAAVGGVIASNSSSNDSSGSQSQLNAKGGNTDGASSTKGGSAAPAATPAPKPIVPLQQWDITDPTKRMIGVSLGNWLVLERWLDEDWFTGVAGQDTYDEWGFTQALGADKAKATLTDHWNTWIQESDFDTMKSVGINSVRIPVGYWAFVDSAKGEPFLSKAGQTDQLQKVFGWLYDRQMYAFIDIHGMPGSQSGDQSTGHKTDQAEWWQDANFGYSYAILNATLDFIKQSNYSSVVHSVCPVNEPMVKGDQGKLAQLTAYYETAYQQIKDAGMIMQFHHGFVANPYDTWAQFATGKDPKHLALNSNPYFGWFPPQSDAGGIIDNVCNEAQQALQFPVPVIMSEYSVINGVGNSNFNTHYYNTQLGAWAWSGGSYFWTFRTKHTNNPVTALASQFMDMYSLDTLVKSGIVQKVDANADPLDMIKQLPQQSCGEIKTGHWSTPSGSRRRRRGVDKRIA